MFGSWPDIGPRQIHAEDDRTPPTTTPTSLSLVAENQSEPVAPRLAAVREQLTLLADYL